MIYNAYLKGSKGYVRIRGNYEFTDNKYIIRLKPTIDGNKMKILLNLPIGSVIKVFLPKKDEYTYYLTNSKRYLNNYIISNSTSLVIGGRYKKDVSFKIVINYKNDNGLLYRYINELYPYHKEALLLKDNNKALTDYITSLEKINNDLLSDKKKLYQTEQSYMKILERQNNDINILKSKLEEQGVYVPIYIKDEIEKEQYTEV